MKKVVVIATILILIVLLGIWAFLSLGRAGGEIGFDATVTSIDGNKVYATVTEDRAGFGSRKLPETIVIYAEDFPDCKFQVGDLIEDLHRENISQLDNIYQRCQSSKAV